MDSFKDVGSSGGRKNSVRVQKRFSSPRPLEILTIGRSNQVQRGSNFAGTITKTLCTYLSKESTNHSMVWEESRNSRARTRFCEKLKNVELRELVNPRVLALRRRVGIHHKELREVLRSRAS